MAQTNLKEVRPEFWEKLEQEYSMPKVEKDEQFAFEPVDRMIADNRWICPIKLVFIKTCDKHYNGDDLLIEDKDFAVVYNGSVGGTYEVFLKHTEQEVRDHITRYGIGRASEDVKAVGEGDDRRRVFGIGAAKNADIPNAE